MERIRLLLLGEGETGVAAAVGRLLSASRRVDLVADAGSADGAVILGRLRPGEPEPPLPAGRPLFVLPAPDDRLPARTDLHLLDPRLFLPGFLELARRCAEVPPAGLDIALCSPPDGDRLGPDRALDTACLLAAALLERREPRHLTPDRFDDDGFLLHAVTRDGLRLRLIADRRQQEERTVRVTASGPAGRIEWWLRQGREELFLDGGRLEPAPIASERLIARYLLDIAGGQGRGWAGPGLLAGALRLRAAAEGGASAYAAIASRIPILLASLPRHREPDDVVRLAPLGLARLAAWLGRRGFPTRLHDLDAATFDGGFDLAPVRDPARVDRYVAGESDPELELLADRLLAGIDLGWPELIGFSVVDVFETFQPDLLRAVAVRIRARRGRPVTIVAGGDLEAVRPERILRGGTVDWAVFGDGERALEQLACLAALGDRGPEGIEGLVRLEGGRAGIGRRARIRLDERPLPDFSGVPFGAYRRGLSHGMRRVLDRLEPAASAGYQDEILFLPYYFVSGCSGRCVFCSFGSHLDVQSPEKSVDEIRRLHELHGVEAFYFLNTAVNQGRRQLARFVELMLARGPRIVWSDSARPDLLDADLAAGLREAGCRMLSYGVESGSDRMLSLMGKGFSAGRAAAALQAAHAAGIVNRVNLIAGFFHESDDDVLATCRFLADNHQAVDIIGCFQGFYLFEGMRIDPDALGIRLRGGAERLDAGQISLTYDEIDGRDWPAKKAAIASSHARISAALDRLGIPRRDKIDDYDLFHLCRLFTDKRRVMRCLLASLEEAT